VTLGKNLVNIGNSGDNVCKYVPMFVNSLLVSNHCIPYCKVCVKICNS
jgi:cadmium resistance protein CadD (predicted permease)